MCRLTHDLIDIYDEHFIENVRQIFSYPLVWGHG